MSRRNLIRRLVLCGLLSWTAMTGCGSAESRNADIRREAYASYAEGMAAFESKQYQEAEANLTNAIDSGGLTFDALCDAHIKRAVCRGAAGKTSEALAELQDVQAHGGDQAALEAARSFIFHRQGNEANARAAWAKARQLNPLIEPYQD